MKRAMTLVHPGTILKLEIEGRGLTITDAAKLLGVTRANLSDILMGSTNISPLLALKLEAKLGGTAGLWVRLQNKINS